MFKEFVNVANEEKFTILGGKLFQTFATRSPAVPLDSVVLIIGEPRDDGVRASWFSETSSTVFNVQVTSSQAEPAKKNSRTVTCNGPTAYYAVSDPGGS